MAFHDQIIFLRKNIGIIAMHVEKFLHKLLAGVIHKSRITLLVPVVAAIINLKQLTLTALGRGLNLPIQERSGIRKVDRLLANGFFQKENIQIYQAVTRLVVGNKKRAAIIVDWTKLPNVNEYALRAALAAESRAITIYEEVHPKKKEGNAKVHRLFLKRLKSMLPEDCIPVMVTDAGFKNPWFEAVLALGWDYVGRVRGLTQYNAGKGYQLISSLFPRATKVPAFLGEIQLSKTNPLKTLGYMVRQNLVGRKRLTKAGKVRRDKDSINYGKNYREPWLLVSSLNSFSAANKVCKIYKTRMTIEEGFRDTKSPEYGFGMKENHTIKRERLIVWLLLAALASFLAYAVGRVAEGLKLHYQFQANSIRHRRVLSFFYLGCEVLRKKMRISVDFSNIVFFPGEEIHA